jgi:N-ethylmaleimide reductase
MKLLTPARLGPYDLKNRMVMAPMTRNRAGEGLAPTQLHVTYYAQRASAGLIVTEATQVSDDAAGYAWTPGIHSDEQVAAWRKVTDAVHARGSRIFLQLWHVGRVSHPSLRPDGSLPVAPSAIAADGNAFTYEGMKPYPVPRALETDEIPGYVRKFAVAAGRAIEAGFDGVELHGANGYLIDQFLRDGTNRRTDRYGGSLENRARFLLEVVDAVTAAVGAARTGVRLSPTGTNASISDSDPERTFTHAVKALSGRGLAYLHLAVLPPADPLNARLRAAFDGTLIVNGGYDRETGEAAIASGAADLVAFGVPFLANPDLPERFAENAPLNVPDRKTFYGGTEAGYIDYPALTAVR